MHPLARRSLAAINSANFRATIIITTRNDEASKFPAMHICATDASGHDVHEFVRRLIGMIIVILWRIFAARAVNRRR
ncbi:hypothetical protein BJA5080_02640 [Bradyrhizobium diazoefficiens SEMIA 5080]|uniref:Uncharacterized protein n=1 Tax=Bradyrhizobium diazoefficiens SEMIA 5080 TaxID=754504 RepID=A0A837CB91_9BRAD|nr:hypothetical protein BJA5080_02640 [Bradyrhizobium diazoefficiens SEMIA 5080]